MSRHRIVRSMNYNDEYDGYDDVYGHSVEDENFSISPTDGDQWLYDREHGQQSMSAFLAHHRNIEEEDEDNIEEHQKQRRDSENFQRPVLNDVDTARLLSCIDEIRNVVGESVSEKQLVETILKNDFDVTKSLDAVLNATTSPSNKEKDISTSSTVEKGIGPRLMEKYTKTPTNVKTTVTTVVEKTVTTVEKTHLNRKGFEVNSPFHSPVVSGRNTPELSDEYFKQQSSTTKMAATPIRNAKELFLKERGDGKEHIHMVVIGHVDAGKSTLMGHLLYDMDKVPQRVMHKHEQESKKMGKQSFMYAWVLDETGEERSRGITMDVGSSRFETKTKMVTLLDAPGHKDFIPNMISGATQADVALLVVDATRGEFETGFEQGGQTREHALLVRSLGVNQLGVVVNKLDTVGWSKERFDEIVNKLKVFLKQAGFKDQDVIYIPCSGLTGENLVKPPTDKDLISWYVGKTLLTVIDNFKTPERAIDKPFRMSVTDIFKGTGSGFCISGRIETGVLCVNDKILVGPTREQAQVKGLSMDDIGQNSVFAGDHVSVTISGVEIQNISVGFILSDIQNPVPLAYRIKARIIVFNIKTPITIGSPVLLHHQSLIEPASIIKLRAQLHKGTGEVIKKNPRCLGNNSCALIEIETTRPICVERYSDFKELGRIMLRVGGVTIAAGLVTDIIK